MRQSCSAERYSLASSSARFVRAPEVAAPVETAVSAVVEKNGQLRIEDADIYTVPVGAKPKNVMIGIDVADAHGNPVKSTLEGLQCSPRLIVAVGCGFPF